MWTVIVNLMQAAEELLEYWQQCLGVLHVSEFGVVTRFLQLINADEVLVEG